MNKGRLPKGRERRERVAGVSFDRVPMGRLPTKMNENRARTQRPQTKRRPQRLSSSPAIAVRFITEAPNVHFHSAASRAIAARGFPWYVPRT